MHQSLSIEPIRRTRTKFCRLHRDDRRARLLRERGMTLIEVMIVLAILALVMGLVIGPKVMDYWRLARIRAATMAVHKLSVEGYAAWAQANPNKECPATIAELGRAGGIDTEDPWGEQYGLLCGNNLPPEAGGLGVFSSGPDKQANTADDLRSWK